ncbi:hypothetical protein G6F56_008005 [Rhizopus delemar]|nr:hypothetical protein G6F56_008005 [Rhizopus delemar]
MLQSLDSTYIEHDAYILFDKLMTYGKAWYEFNEGLPSSSRIKKDTSSENIPKPSESARLNPIVMICHRIHHEHLRKADPVLYKHLQDFGIEPQLYGLRWIRLLFGREFEMNELFKLWDAIFSQDPTLDIVEYVCLVMLLYLRDQLIKKDYAECLSMLMRPPYIADPINLVKKAKTIQGNVSSNTGLLILREIDAQSGKTPRTSLYDGVPTPVVDPRHTLQHRSSHGSNLDNSFSRITNNVMRTPQFREFNKAIAGVMESFQNNVNFSETTESARRSKYSEFPPSIDRVLPKSRNDGVSISVKAERDADVARLLAMNKQMGKVVSDFISLLEKEIFSPSESEEQETSECQLPEQESEQTSDQTSDQVSNEERSQDEMLEKEIQNVEQKPKQTHNTKDNAEVLHAMTGLKHVRDVLLGKQPRFDPDAVNMPDEDWAIVDHSEAAGTPTEPKQEEKKIDCEKPLPELKRHTSTFFETKLPHVHVPYVSDNPTPPKPAVKYRIEDLLSDPGLQSNSKALANAKLKSILTEQEENTPHEIYRSSPRKRSSFYTNKAIPVAGENTIDPLDAKNVDNRKAYEYDVI